MNHAILWVIFDYFFLACVNGTIVYLTPGVWEGGADIFMIVVVPGLLAVLIGLHIIFISGKPRQY